jgi:hypothetical protein
MEKKVRIPGEGCILAVLFIITGVFFAQSVGLFLTARSVASTGGFPLIVSVMMVLADLSMLLELLRKKPVKHSQAVASEKAEYSIPVVYMIIAMVFYVTLLPRLGMVISTFAFLAYSFYFLSFIRPRNILMISAGSGALLVLIFKFVFQVNLP